MRRGSIPIIFMTIGCIYCGLPLPAALQDSSTFSTAQRETTMTSTSFRVLTSTSTYNPLGTPTAATTEQPTTTKRFKPSPPVPGGDRNPTRRPTTPSDNGTRPFLHGGINTNRSHTTTTIESTWVSTAAGQADIFPDRIGSAEQTPHCRQGSCGGNETCLSSTITDTCPLLEGEYCYQIIHVYDVDKAPDIEVGCKTDCEHLVETNVKNRMGTVTSTTRCCDTNLCNQEQLANRNERGATSPIAYSLLALFSTQVSLFILE